jgi:CSLREA domain-containing protein
MKRSPRLVPTLLTALGFTAALVVAGPAPQVLAATIAVNTTADEVNSDGDCSLREAIITANSVAPSDACTAGGGADTIAVPAGTYTLTIPEDVTPDDAEDGDLDVASEITLDPTGVVIIDGGDVQRVFDVLVGPGVALTASDLTIRNGSDSGDGGGIDSKAGLTLTGVTLSGNESESGGGGLNVDSGTATLANVTISGNLADGSGGGLSVAGGTVILSNVTVANNTADNNADGTGDGGGISVTGGTATVSNTIVGDNTDQSTGADPKHNDCSGTLSSGGYNLVEDITGCTIGGTTTGNITGVNPGLNPLADNGGPTQTHALKRKSPAVDAGNPAAPGSGGTACQATDQRGMPRPQGPRCDIGSFEREAAGPAGPQCLGVPVTITGTGADETLTGTNKADGIRGLAGNDLIRGLRGKDGLCAGAGNDVAKGDEGPDRIAGQGGNDRGVGGSAGDLIKGGKGRDRLRGKKQNDTLRGGGGRDRLNGGPGFDVCRGGPGRDRFRRCEVRSG